jgi:putative hydrolase
VKESEPDLSFNRAAAEILRHCGQLLRQQRANPFRVNAYLRAAQTLEALPEDAREILRARGTEGLTELPFIGTGLGAAIEEIARTGKLTRLDRLRGMTEPEALLKSVPGIGPALAKTLHDELHVDTLEALEIAAHDGRLEALKGLGPRRAAAIRASLATLLGRPVARRPLTGPAPSVRTLLAVDDDYRRAAAAGRLPLIAPRRFNPEAKAWLPILHTDRDGWHFTLLYSNTAKAHELGRTGDWVVAYFYDGDHREGQHTIVTETHGPLEGRRVVRGREAECAAVYRAADERHATSADS